MSAMTSMSSTIELVFPGDSLGNPERRELLLAFTRFMLEADSQRCWATQVQRWPVHQGVIAEQMASGEPNRQAILALRQQIARAVAQLFDGYQPGLNPDDVPPLLGYEVVEKNIHERDWK